MHFKKKTYIHTYILTSTHTCGASKTAVTLKDTYIHTYIHTYIQAHIPMVLHTLQCTLKDTYIHTYTHASIHTCGTAYAAMHSEISPFPPLSQACKKFLRIQGAQREHDSNNLSLYRILLWGIVTQLVCLGAVVMAWSRLSHPEAPVCVYECVCVCMYV